MNLVRIRMGWDEKGKCERFHRTPYLIKERSHGSCAIGYELVGCALGLCKQGRGNLGLVWPKLDCPGGFVDKM